MDKVMFALFLVSLSAWTAVALYGTVLNVRLLLLGDNERQRRGHRNRILVKVGFATMSSVILIAIIQAGTAHPSVYAWVYVTGLNVTGVGLAGMTKDAMTELIEHEITTEPA